MIENIDLNFTIWLSSFDLLEGFFILLSSKYFSLFLVLLFAIYMIKLERLKTFAFIFLATCFGDMTGNFLKNFLAQPRPCFEHSDYLISSGVIDQACGPSLTGMPSNHALNYFIFTTLVIMIIKNRAISLFFIITSCLVGLSRIFLAKHLLSQVIIGGLIGVLLGIAFYLIYKAWNQRQISQ